MIPHDPKGQAWARCARIALHIFATACAGALVASPAVAASQPSIGSVTSNAAAGGVPRYGKLDLAFPVKTQAPNLFLPYDPVAPAYVKNLRPTEDARNGVSVDGLFLPPGQTDWSQALVQPGFFKNDYDASDYPLGTSGWHVRFAPTQVGQWQYELRVTDAGGTVTSAPAAFTCVTSASHGFLRVSPTDSRYFEFSDGTPFLAAGLTNYADVFSLMQNLNNSHATGLIRLWLSSNGGADLVGGFADNPISRNFGAAGSWLTTESAHTGRYSLGLPAGGGPELHVFGVKPNTTYTFSGYVKTVGTDSTTAFYISHVGQQALANTTDWQPVSLTWNSGSISGQFICAVQDAFNAHGHMLLDDFTVTGPNGGDLLGGDGTFEWHTNYNQAVAASLDTIADTAEASGQYLKLVCLEKDDAAWGEVLPDGTVGSPAALHSEGGSSDPHADTAVQRFQRFYARYLMARWGYATSIHSLEFMNEGGDAGAGSIYDTAHYAGAQAFAAAAHAYSAMGRRLVSTSCVDNTGGSSFARQLYVNDAYPDIDYADMHYYPQASQQWGAYLPFGDAAATYGTGPSAPVHGSYRQTTGGPNGLGQLVVDSSTPSSGSAGWVLPVLRGRGTWTVSFFYRSSPDVTFKTYSSGVQIHLADLPNGYKNMAGTLPRSPVANWTQFTDTFTISDDNPRTNALLTFYGNAQTGTTSFADFRLTAPDGRVFYRLKFDEPTFDQDSASMVANLGLNQTSYSGDASIGKPLVLGELDLIAPHPPQAAISDYARGAAWGQLNASAAIPIFWRDSSSQIDQAGGWRYAGAVQAFLAGVPLSNGRFRELGASVTNGISSIAPPVLRLYGQKDVQDGLAFFWAQNRGSAGDNTETADWWNLLNNPAAVLPVSATVSVPGLPDGAYQVEAWDTTTGQVVATQVLTTQGGVLQVPVNTLNSDEAVKIYPAAAPRLALHLSADKTVAKSGDVVTYTLAYTNQGTTPALGVNVPWSVPDHMQFVSAPGGAYDAGQNTVSWKLGTLAPGGTGSLTLTVRVN